MRIRLALRLILIAFCIAPTAAHAANSAEQWNMRLVGHDSLQGRSAYQPVIHRQGTRWFAYIGHHGGKIPNPLTGQVEQTAPLSSMLLSRMRGGHQGC